MAGNPWHDERGRFTSKDGALESYDNAVQAAQNNGDTVEAERLAAERDEMIATNDPESARGQEILSKQYGFTKSSQKVEEPSASYDSQRVAKAFRNTEMGDTISVQPDILDQVSVNHTGTHISDESLTFYPGEDLEVEDSEWQVMTGFGSSDPDGIGIMHPSEQIDGGPADYMAKNPGKYVTLPVDDEDGEPVGWALLRKKEDLDETVVDGEGTVTVRAEGRDYVVESFDADGETLSSEIVSSREAAQSYKETFVSDLEANAEVGDMSAERHAAANGNPYTFSSVEREAENLYDNDADIVSVRDFAVQSTAHSDNVVAVQTYQEGSVRNIKVYKNREDFEANHAPSSHASAGTTEVFSGGRQEGVPAPERNVDPTQRDLSKAQQMLAKGIDDEEVREQAAIDAEKESGGLYNRVEPLGDEKFDIQSSTYRWVEINEMLHKQDIRGITKTSDQPALHADGVAYTPHRVTLTNKEGQEVTYPYALGSGHRKRTPSKHEIIESAVNDTRDWEDHGDDYDSFAEELGEKNLDSLREEGYSPGDEEWRSYEAKKRKFENIGRYNEAFKSFFGDDEWEQIKYSDG